MDRNLHVARHPKLSPPKGTSREVAKRFRAIVAAAPSGYWSQADTAQLLALAAIEVAFPAVLAGGDLAEIDKATNIAGRLRRTLGLATAATTTRHERLTKVERASLQGSVPEDADADTGWSEDRWESAVARQ